MPWCLSLHHYIERIHQQPHSFCVCGYQISTNTINKSHPQTTIWQAMIKVQCASHCYHKISTNQVVQVMSTVSYACCAHSHTHSFPLPTSKPLNANSSGCRRHAIICRVISLGFWGTTASSAESTSYFNIILMTWNNCALIRGNRLQARVMGYPSKGTWIGQWLMRHSQKQSLDLSTEPATYALILLSPTLPSPELCKAKQLNLSFSRRGWVNHHSLSFVFSKKSSDLSHDRSSYENQVPQSLLQSPWSLDIPGMLKPSVCKRGEVIKLYRREHGDKIRRKKMMGIKRTAQTDNQSTMTHSTNPT